MSLTGHHMPPRTTQQSHRPRVSDRTMVGTLPPRCLQALPHGTKNAATDGPGYRATPRSTTEPHRGWMSDTYLLHLHAEGEKCFLLTSPFIEPAQNFQLNNCCADAHSMPWAAAEAKPSKRIVCSLGNPDGAVLGKPRGGSSRRNTKAAVGYITAKMLPTEPKAPTARFFMSGAPVWRVPIRVVVNALSPNSL